MLNLKNATVSSLLVSTEYVIVHYCPDGVIFCLSQLFPKCEWAEIPLKNRQALGLDFFKEVEKGDFSCVEIANKTLQNIQQYRKLKQDASEMDLISGLRDEITDEEVIRCLDNYQILSRLNGTDVQALLDYVISQVKHLNSDAAFVVQDLFPLIFWHQLPISTRNRLGLSFLHWAESHGKALVKLLNKSSQNQQIYLKI